MIETKVLVPCMGGAFVARPRLEVLGDRLLEVPLALVTGAGGFGKSTVLGSWAERLRERARVAWLSLEPQDASLSAVVEGIWFALRRTVPDLGESIQRLLESGSAAPEAFVAPLVNELYVLTEEREEHVVLFLDDVQFVLGDEGGCVAFLSSFARTLPPRVHLVLASRRTLSFPPISKLRAAGRLLEVDEGALRFRGDEAAALVNDADAAHALVERTDGWAMAVQLTANLVRSHGSDAESAFPRTREALFEFLAEEVVAHQPEPLRRDLYALALPPTIDEATAGELLGRADGAATLDAMAARGLYLARVDPQTWRFHHLFREFLLSRFRRDDPRRECSLRKRYATILRRQGQKIDALGQLIDAGEYLEIVDYVQEALITIRFSDRYKQILYLLSQVPEAVKREKPMLYRLYAMALQRSGAAFEAEEQLKLCFDAAMAIADYATACKAQLELGMYADNFRFQGHGEFSRSEQHFDLALGLVGRLQEPEAAPHRAVGSWLKGMAQAAQFRYDDALELLRIAEEYERSSPKHDTQILVDLALVHGWRGEWRAALEYAEQAEECFRSGGGEILVGHALAIQVRSHLALREDIPRANRLAFEALETFQRGQQDEEMASAHCLIGACALAHTPPDIDRARIMADEAERKLAAVPNPVVRFDVALLRAEAAILAGHDEEARRRLSEAEVIAARNGDRLQQAIVIFTLGVADVAARRGHDARQRLEDACKRFHELHDRFHEAVAELACLACAVRDGDIEGAAVSRFFDGIDDRHLGFAVTTTPRSASQVLVWCLEHGQEIERAERILGPRAGDHAEGIARIAGDERNSSRARTAAIRILARVAAAVQRGLLTRLARDRDSLVAGAAETALRLMPASGAPALGVAVVGELYVTLGDEHFGERDGRWTRKKAAELLRLLVVSGGMVTKAAAIEVLWPERSGNVETSLRVTLHALRRALQPESEGCGDYVEYDGEALRLRHDALAPSDTIQAERALKQGQYGAARGDLQEARRDLMRAAELLKQAPREDDVAEWLRPHVRRWRGQLGEAHRARAAVERKSGDPQAALLALDAALSVDPLDEDSVCALLELYLEQGAIERARDAFLDYKQRLAKDLSLTPGPEILERYSRVLARRAAPVRSGLTERELEILGLVARGKANKEIASTLATSVGNVANALSRIMRKLKVESRAAAVAVAGGLLDREN